MVTNPPANSWNPGDAGQEDPLEDEMAAHFIILTWKTPQTEESGRLQSGGHQESDTMEHSHTHSVLYYKIGFVLDDFAQL